MSVTGGSQIVLKETEGNVGVITLNRPEARNALNRQLLTELQQAIDEAVADTRIGAIVLTGNGPAFCAGADLKEAAEGMDSADFWSRYERANQSLRIHHELPRLPKPIIAAVNGYAVAGGCGVAMSCDIVFAGEGAQFGYPEVNRGLVAAMVMVSLTRLVGRRHALDLLLSGRLIRADEALTLGMVNRVVPDDEVRSVAIAYAQDLADKPASAIRITKDLYRQVVEIDYDRALEYARDVNQMMRQTRDAQEGAASFANKNKGS
ncbi:enoyl-CoA hydratase/isomerase family protein [Conexibacter sp. S30A1]|uniref:enoyl-CoA hydratase/isomerase family protein n=1 Tax=Conexibacter sp. S30A1 TaxID=2937800 RepID=UPI00200D8BA1|nr:enoyl-CoA hydratase/isomerase family protein [Conexibacter sp. S30A1]